jgi:hypothetical protein
MADFGFPEAAVATKWAEGSDELGAAHLEG